MRGQRNSNTGTSKFEYIHINWSMQKNLENRKSQIKKKMFIKQSSVLDVTIYDVLFNFIYNVTGLYHLFKPKMFKLDFRSILKFTFIAYLRMTHRTKTI